MDSNNFRSTVLQRPGVNDNDDRDRRHHRDILNPTSPALAPPPGAVGPPPGPPPRHSAFSLRSPTQTEFHHPPSYPPQSGSHHSPPRPPLSSFMSSGVASPAAPLPPPGQAAGSGHLGGGPLSPHRSSGYYAHQQQDLHPAPPAREKQSSGGGSFYDPLTDTMNTKERRTSDTGSWHGAAAQLSPPKVRKNVRFLVAIVFILSSLGRRCVPCMLPCSPYS
jgi:DNA helicase INO80